MCKSKEGRGRERERERERQSEGIMCRRKEGRGSDRKRGVCIGVQGGQSETERGESEWRLRERRKWSERRE